MSGRTEGMVTRYNMCVNVSLTSHLTTLPVGGREPWEAEEPEANGSRGHTGGPLETRGQATFLHTWQLNADARNNTILSTYHHYIH